MANATSFLKPSAMVTPLQFSDSGRIDFRFLRYSTGVYHTLWCYVVNENGEHIQDEQHHDIRILLAKEDNIDWNVPNSFPNYRFSLPETTAEFFDFSTPANCYVNFALFTYSSNTYSGSSIIGTKWFSNYGDTSIEAPSSEKIKVQPSNKMYPQIRLIITDETEAYRSTGGKYFYLDNDVSQTDLSSNGNIKVEIKYYSGHEPESGAISQNFCQINGQMTSAVFTNNGLNYNRNTTIGGTSIINAESKTNFRISVIDGQGLNSEYTTSITWANDIGTFITKFNDLKELSEDDLRYDYRLGTPVPTSLYLAPDWTATQYTTAPVPDDWEYYADIGDNGTGLINQRDILNDQKRQLNLQLFRKYYRYIQEGTWLDDSYIDDNLYYLDANKILNQSSYPKATYTIDVVDINGIEKYAAYEFTLGQRTYVEDPDMFGYVYKTVAGGEVKTPFKKEVIISERSRNLDDPSKSTIKVQTYKNQWEDIFSSLTATTQSLQYASGGYARAANAVNPNGSINVHSLEQTFQQGDFALSGSATQSITWDGSYGIEITDLSNSLIKLRIASNGLAITTDGGTTWNNAITGNGINTNYLLAGQIDASKINIISKEGDYAFSWNEKGLNAVLPLQEGDDPDDAGNSYVRFNDLGIYGTTEGSIIEAWEDSHPSADVEARINYIKQHSNFLLTWDGLTLTSTDIDGNVISLNPDIGLEIFNADESSPWSWDASKIAGTTFNVDPKGNSYTEGDKIPVITLGEFYNGNTQSNQYGLLMRNSDGEPTLYNDESGNLTMIGDITANSITVNQGFLKRLYLENNSRISYLGANKNEGSSLADDDVLISIGKSHTTNYTPGKFIVRADGKYFGELAALNYVAAWDNKIYSSENVEPDQNAYAILLGPHDTSYIFSAFKTNTTRGTRVFDVRTDGTVDIEGTLNARNGVRLLGELRAYADGNSSNDYIYINGTAGEIGHSYNSWKIDKTGYAEFQNAHIRGTLSTIVFEKKKVSMVGGDLVISPTFYIEEEIPLDGQGGWDITSLSVGDYYIDFANNSPNPNQVIFYVAEDGEEESNEFDGQYYFGEIRKEAVEGEDFYFLDSLQPSEDNRLLINKLYSIDINTTPYSGGPLTKGSNITIANLMNNVIRLTANQTQGASIIVGGSGSSGAQSQLGYINFSGDADTEMRQLAQNQYGLYSNNAFLEGKLYLPNSGMTNEPEYPSNVDIYENDYIVLAQGYTSQSVTGEFTISDNHNEDFNKIREWNVTNTAVLIKINDSFYAGRLNYSGLFCSISYDSDYSYGPELFRIYGVEIENSVWGTNAIVAGTILFKMPEDFTGHNIRIWAGASPGEKANAPFIVTQEGSLYAESGYFNGKVRSFDAILGNEIDGNGDYISIGINSDGTGKIDYRISKLSDELEDNLDSSKSYTDDAIVNFTNNVHNPLVTSVSNIENTIANLQTYLVIPGEATFLKSTGSIMLKITSDTAAFYNNNSIITSWSNDLMTGAKANIQSQLKIGGFTFVNSSGNLRLVKGDA